MIRPRTVREHYRHARSLGAFRAVDCLRIARAAAELDRTSAEARTAVRVASCWTTAYRETWPDGSAPIRLTDGVRVF